MADSELTPSVPDTGKQPPDVRASDRSGDDIPLPEEFEQGDETVAADTASGGAPEPAGDSADG
jgi:hypothetical protein